MLFIQCVALFGTAILAGRLAAEVVDVVRR